DDAGADLDALRAHAHRGEKRERRGQLPREMMDAHERAVDAELLGGDRELDGLAQCVLCRPCLRPLGALPVAEREKPDALSHYMVIVPDMPLLGIVRPGRACGAANIMI